MRRLFSIVAASVVIALLFPAATATGQTCWSYSKQERAFARKMNSARAKRNAHALRLDPELSRVAAKQTRSMIDKKLLHHTPVNKLKKRVTRWVMLGENVGYGGSVKSLHKAFMRSSAHKANILNRRYRFVGVGAKRAHGYMWVTIVFQAKKNPGTTLKMPKC